MKIGDWTVLPSQNLIQRGSDSMKLEPREMDLLVYLSKNAERVVSTDELLRDVWHGRVFDEGVVYKKINRLRKALGDDSHNPRFIETIPKRGYRLVAGVVADGVPAAPDLAGPALERLPSREPVPSHPPPHTHTVGPPSTTDAPPTALADAPPAALTVAPPCRPPLAPTLASPRTQRFASPHAPRPRSARAVGLGTVLAVLAVVAAVGGLALRNATLPAIEERLTFMPLAIQRDGSELLVNYASTVWSPDGQAIAFSALDRDRGGLPQPYVRYLASPTAVPLANLDGGYPKAWTRQGGIVLNTGRGIASSGLVVVPAVGAEARAFFAFPERTENVMSVSADGASVAALRYDSGRFDVWTAALPDGPFERYEPAPFSSPDSLNVPMLAFSPDGQQLLLMLNPGLGAGEQGWLMPYPADPARPPRRVLEALPRAWTPMFSWLPDNRHVIVSSAAAIDRPVRLYLADTISGRFRLLVDAPSEADQIAPLVSPDGKRLLFTEVQRDLDIVTLDVVTGAVTPLIATHRVEEMPAWAADAGVLVYVADRDGKSLGEIWLRDAAGQDRPLVTERDFPGGARSVLMAPQLSPDGSRVIYTRIELDARGGAVAMRQWMSTIAGGAPVRLTDSPAVRENGGAWSPGGDWYVYSEGGPELSTGLRMSIKKVPTSGRGEPAILVAATAPSRFLPAWSPDGQWILYDDDGLKLVSADGERIRDLGIEDSACTFAAVEPVLYCILDLPRAGTFAVVDFDGTVVRDVGPVATADRPQALSHPALRLSLAPDGSRIAYSVFRSRSQLWVVDGFDTVALP